MNLTELLKHLKIRRSIVIWLLRQSCNAAKDGFILREMFGAALICRRRVTQVCGLEIEQIACSFYRTSQFLKVGQSSMLRPQYEAADLKPEAFQF